jgi:hypothetical protein
MATRRTRVRLQHTSRRRRARIWPAVQVGVAAIVFVAALLAVAPAQSYRLFQARVVASEGSVWVLLAACLVLLTARPGRRGFVVATLAALSIAAARDDVMAAVAALKVHAPGLGLDPGRRVQRRRQEVGWRRLLRNVQAA